MNSCKLLSVDSNIIKSSRDEPHDQQLFGTLSNFSVSRVRDCNSERVNCGVDFGNNRCDTAAAPRDDRASTLDTALTVPQDSGTHFTCCFQTHKHLAPPFPPPGTGLVLQRTGQLPKVAHQVTQSGSEPNCTILPPRHFLKQQLRAFLPTTQE